MATFCYIMCRNIKTLFNFDPPVTEVEIREASLQFVKKISGFNKPSKVNNKVFNQAVEKISTDSQKFLNSLVTDRQPRIREIEAQHVRTRSAKRFGMS